MINVIVFSKDRACQLDLLWRSIERYVKSPEEIQWSLVYLGSNPHFQQGYQVFNEAYGKKIKVINEREKGFRNTVLSLLNSSVPYHLFLVDDDCFKEEWDHKDGYLKALDSRDVLSVSLRMDPKYDFCYTQQKPMKIPTIDPSGYWQWQGCQGDWGYPMSLDGHVFRTADIVPLIQRLPFANPNSLEAQLAHNVLRAPRMRLYSKAKIVNIPTNKVQVVNRNVSGLVHATNVEALNAEYLKGKRILLDSVSRATGLNAPHYEIPLVFGP